MWGRGKLMGYAKNALDGARVYYEDDAGPAILL